MLGNDTGGHVEGDRLLKDAASALREVFDPRFIFRAGGDEFVAIMTDVTEDDLKIKAEKLREGSVKYKDLVFAIGYAYEENFSDVRTALHIADERMYEDKKHYYELHPRKK